MTIPLTDILTTAESVLEQKLCVCLILSPSDVLRLAGEFKPEVSGVAKYFWQEIQDRKDLLFKSSPDQQFEICYGLIHKKNPKILWRWWDLLGGENSYLAIEKTLSDIRALRVARKSVDYLEKNETLMQVYDQERYGYE